MLVEMAILMCADFSQAGNKVLVEAAKEHNIIPKELAIRGATEQKNFNSA
jgi:hypothetical protein